MTAQGPTYDLSTVKALVSANAYQVTGAAFQSLGQLALDRRDLEACVLGLTAADFFKTMPSERIAGLWQDVYKPVYDGRHLYVKLQISLKQGSSQQVVIISFKRK